MSFRFSDLQRWFEAAEVACEFNSLARGSAADVAMPSLSFDSRHVQGGMFCGVAGEHTHGARFVDDAIARGAEGIWVEATRLDDFAALDDRIPVVATSDARSALAVAARSWLAERAITVVAITGSNGKTTTKDLTRAALGSLRVAASPGNLNSGWGLPAAVLSLPDELDVAVLEMGASAVGEIDALCAIAPPHISVITNVGAAHLEFFGSRDEVARTKAGVLRHLPEDGLAVLPRDDEYYGFFQNECAVTRQVSFGASADAQIRIRDARGTASGVHASIDGVEVELPVFGVVNAWNAAAAVGVARCLGLDTATALRAMTSAEYSPHRSRILLREDGCILDDSYNANPSSMMAALEELARRESTGRRIAVLGSMAELGADSASLHRDVVAGALGLGLDCVWVVGSEMTAAAEELDDPRLVCASSVDELVSSLLLDARSDDTWLVKASRSVGLERVVEALASTPTPARELEGGEAH